MSAAELATEKCIAFTTYRKSGEAVTTPVWVAPVSDGRLGFWTAMGSGKTKRLKNNPAVAVQPCSFTGKLKPGTSPVSGTAEMVQSGPLFDEVHQTVHKKYGFMTFLTKTIATLTVMRKAGMTYADTVVLIRVEG
ncbi:MAG: PPOX class F420-dependent oxidoreductase [Aeromicrobium sp.]